MLLQSIHSNLMGKFIYHKQQSHKATATQAIKTNKQTKLSR
jgi:hypothetical protein